jgi:hypothetical protein
LSLGSAIADLLKDGPLDTEKLAAAVGVHAPTLYRVLRTLASVGIFAEAEDGRFGLTPQAEPLRSDAHDSIRDCILLVGEEWYSGPSDHLLHSVQTGRPYRVGLTIDAHARPTRLAPAGSTRLLDSRVIGT